MHVPPSSKRVPAAYDPLDADSWLRSATALASSYVVPPTTKIITSCGLNKLKSLALRLITVRTFAIQHSDQRHRGTGSLCPVVGLLINSRAFETGEACVACTHSLRPTFMRTRTAGRTSKLYL